MDGAGTIVVVVVEVDRSVIVEMASKRQANMHPNIASEGRIRNG